MAEQSISKVIKNNLYNYKYLIEEYDYSVFVETITEEIIKEIELNENT